MGLRHREVLKVAASPIRPTEHGRHDPGAIGCDETESRIPTEICNEWLTGIDVAKRNAGGSAPESDDRIVICCPEFPNVNVHGSP
jgi:hypothetical protein